MAIRWMGNAAGDALNGHSLDEMSTEVDGNGKFDPKPLRAAEDV